MKNSHWLAAFAAGSIALTACGSEPELPSRIGEQQPNDLNRRLDAGQREFGELDAATDADSGAADAGAGSLLCETGTANCDEDESNGCESLSEEPNCGDCGKQCDAAPAACQEANRCQGDQCVFSLRAAGKECRAAQCTGDLPEVCDGQNPTCAAPCGCDGQDCCAGSVCGAGLICNKGKCGELSCNAGTANCDGDSSNGCESLNRLPNCGACGEKCNKQPDLCEDAGQCEDEQCLYEKKAAGTTCRPSQCAGDPVEACTGTRASCPSACGCRGQQCCRGANKCGDNLACRASGKCETPCPVPTLSGRFSLCSGGCDVLQAMSANGNVLTFRKDSRNSSTSQAPANIALSGFTMQGETSGSCRRQFEDVYKCPRVTRIVANGSTLVVHYEAPGGGGRSTFTVQGATATGSFSSCERHQGETFCSGISQVQAAGNRLSFVSGNGKQRGSISFTSTCK